MTPKEQLRPVEWADIKDAVGIRMSGVFHAWTRDADGDPCAIVETGRGEIYTPVATRVRFLDSGSKYSPSALEEVKRHVAEATEEMLNNCPLTEDERVQALANRDMALLIVDEALRFTDREAT